MQRPHRTLVPLLAVAGLASACAQVPAKGGFGDVEQLAAERGAGGIAWSADAEEQDAILARTAPRLEGELGLGDAVEVALLRSPSLQAAYEELGVAQADLVQASRPANPTLSVNPQWGLSGDLGTSQAFDLTLDLLQLALLPARRDLATRDFAATKLRVAGEVLSAAAAVRADYYGLVASQELLAALRDLDGAARTAADYAERLVEAGNLPERELLAQRALAEETHLGVLGAEAEAAEARARLARALATRPGEDGWSVPGRLPALGAEALDVAGLEAEAAERRLDVLAAAAASEALAQAHALARRWRWVPLVEVGVTSDREPEGGWSLGPSLALALPVFDQGQANVARLAAAQRRAERELAAARLDARSDVREAAARLAGARARAERLRRETLPLHARLVALTLREYNYMIVGAFELLAARQDELAAYRDSLSALRDAWIAHAELELALGRKLPAPAAEPARDGEAEPAPPAPSEGHEHHHHGGH